MECSLRQTLFTDILPRVQTPGQYAGNEFNSVRKDPNDVNVRVALAFPDLYAIGMSYTGFKILYGRINREPDLAAERVFCPWPDMEKEMRENRIPLYSLETFTPLSEFDIIAVTIQHEFCLTNILTMLDLAGIPLMSAERTGKHPLVIGGGPFALNPEPAADFFDAFQVGDGEEALPSLCAVVKEESARQAVLERAAQEITGMYVPSFYREEDGCIVADQDNVPYPIQRNIIPDLDAAFYPTQPVVPYVRTEHNRITLEIMRGCPNRCRFCQAAGNNLPLRWRTPEHILELAKESYQNTGYDELGLLSLSNSNYPEIIRLLTLLQEHFTPLRVNISMPSLRITPELEQLPAILSAVRKGGITLAPEAATARMRRIINKPIADKDIVNSALAAYRAGWNKIKTYFMVGLPGEQDVDVAAIAPLAERLSNLGRDAGKRPGNINVSVAPFIPKPHTVFQWAPMDTREELKRKRELIFHSKKSKRIRISFHDTDKSFLEAALARGTRKHSGVVLRAWQLGQRFDSWTDCFRFHTWQQAFADAGIRPEDTAHNAYDVNDRLPWNHIQSRQDTEYMKKEYLQSLTED